MTTRYARCAPRHVEEHATSALRYLALPGSICSVRTRVAFAAMDQVRAHRRSTGLCYAVTGSTTPKEISFGRTMSSASPALPPRRRGFCFAATADKDTVCTTG